MFLILIVLIIYVVVYLYVVVDFKKILINLKMLYFIMYFVVFFMSEMGRSDFVVVFVKDLKLGVIVSELKKVYMIVNKFYFLMLEVFCFFVRRILSKMFVDFFDRFVYFFDSGVDLKEYFFQEQKIVMDDYEIFYEGVFYDFDVFKEIYELIIILVVFIVLFIIIGLIIMGMDIGRMGFYVFFMIIVVEVGVLFVVKFRMLEDLIWVDSRGIRDFKRECIKMVVIYFSIGIVILMLVYFLFIRQRFSIFELFVVVMVFILFYYFGMVVDREEKCIFRKDENFLVFIRSFSFFFVVSGVFFVFVFKYFSVYDFGLFMDDIKVFYRRFVIRVDRDRVWDFFIVGIGSWFIGIFFEIFRESLYMGVELDYVGLVISRNFERIVRFRRKRQQSIVSFIGIIYGFIGVFVFVFVVFFQVVVLINDLFLKMDFGVVVNYIGDIIYVIFLIGMIFLMYIMLMMMVFYLLFLVLVIKLVDGGYVLGFVKYFVILVWIFVVGMYFGQILMVRMMGMSSGGIEVV